MTRVLMVASVASVIKQFNMENIRVLQELGCAVEVACNFENGNSCSLRAVDDLKLVLESMNVTYHQIDFVRSPVRILSLAKSFFQIKELTKGTQFAFIHCQTAVASILVRQVARIVNTPVVYTAHGFHFHQGGPIIAWMLFYPLERLMSSYTEALITINQEDYLTAKAKFHMKHLYHIHAVGVNLERFARNEIKRRMIREELNITDSDFLILSVGELNTNKNHKVVIESLGMVTDPSVKYAIVGQGHLQQKLMKMVKTLRLEDRVFLLGYREDVPSLVSAADLFAFPSRREGMGLACIEAMAAGVPAVGSPVRGIREYIIPGQTGYLCSPDDSTAYAESIRKLRGDKLLLEKLGENACEMSMRYDIKITNNFMKEIYAKVLSDSIERLQ